MKHRNAVIILANFWLAMGARVRRHGSEILIDDACGFRRRIDTDAGTITAEIEDEAWTEPVAENLETILIVTTRRHFCRDATIRRVIADLVPTDTDVHFDRLVSTVAASARRVVHTRALMAEIDRHRIDQMYLNRIPVVEEVS